MKILILCTGNSCRSQMAKGILKSFDKKLQVFSAGTKPEKNVNPFAVLVMNEIGIDISNSYPKNVNKFVNENFEYVITVCNNAREICPVFIGDVKFINHIGFDDPCEATGTEDEILSEYRRIRDEIFTEFEKFYESLLI